MLFVRLSRQSKSLKQRIRQRDKRMRPDQYVDSYTQTDTGPENIVNDTPVDPLAPPKKIRDTTWMMTNVNKQYMVANIGLEDIQQSANEVTSKGGYELLCSYSWKQTDTPTIYVPGTPAIFTFQDPEAVPIVLEADTGTHWIDQHAERAPKHQFEPIFEALARHQPDERFDHVDIIVNRSSLQQLLKWIGNKSTQAFYLDLDIVGNTHFLGRKVKKAKAASMPNSYGRNFEDYFTTEDPELENAEGDHRVLKYEFGGLNMVIRIEVDAYVPNTKYDFIASVVLHPACAPDGSAGSGIVHRSPETTVVISKGTLIPQSLMIELKSNVDFMPIEQMWFGRTPHCARGRLEKPKATQDQVSNEAISTDVEIPKCKLRRLDVDTMDKKSVDEWELKNQEGLGNWPGSCGGCEKW